MSTATARRQVGAELINAPQGAQESAPTARPADNGRFPSVNGLSTADPQITAPRADSDSAPSEAPQAYTRRYSVACRACGTKWTEDVAEGERPGETHACTAYEGDDLWRYAVTIEAKAHRHYADNRPHPCTSECWNALGHVCRCECGGERHGEGRLRERAMPAPLVLVEHTTDADCLPFLDPDTDCCSVCGVYFGEPCSQCGDRGFHKPECPLNDETHPDPSLSALYDNLEQPWGTR